MTPVPATAPISITDGDQVELRYWNPWDYVEPRIYPNYDDVLPDPKGWLGACRTTLATRSTPRLYTRSLATTELRYGSRSMLCNGRHTDQGVNQL